MRLKTFSLIIATLMIAIATMVAQTPGGSPAFAVVPSGSPSAAASPSASSDGGSSSSALGLGPLAKGRPKDAKTEITSEKEATFDNAAGIATFTGNVIVKDPQMTLNCDTLVVTLDKAHKGMQRADATGNVYMTHEGLDGTKHVHSTGKAEHAIYDPATGDLLLLGWPQIQQGINDHISTEEGTRMTLNRNSHLTTQGASKTVIIDTNQSNPTATPKPTPQQVPVLPPSIQ